MKKFFANLYCGIKNADVFGKKTFTVLYSAIFACVLIIGAAQVGLKNTYLRRYLTDVDKYEGAYFEATAEVGEKEYEITLYAEAESFENAEIWLNGKSYSSLTSGENFVKITDTSVVEIYSPKNPVSVKLTDMTDGLMLYTENKELNDCKGIQIFGRFGIK